jgi:hypothetical protein
MNKMKIAPTISPESITGLALFWNKNMFSWKTGRCELRVDQVRRLKGLKKMDA